MLCGPLIGAAACAWALQAQPAGGTMSEEGQDGAASGIGAWVKQFDPQANKHYYWHPDTDECVWEQPPDFVAGTSDSRVEAATKIQSAMRGASVRSSQHSATRGVGVLPGVC